MVFEKNQRFFANPSFRDGIRESYAFSNPSTQFLLASLKDIYDFYLAKYERIKNHNYIL